MRTFVFIAALALAASLLSGTPFIPAGTRIAPAAAPSIAVQKRSRR